VNHRNPSGQPDGSPFDTARELRLLIDTLPIGIVVVDRQFRYRVVNTTYAAIAGRPADELVGATVASIVGPEVFQGLLLPALKRVFDGEELRFERPWRVEDYADWCTGAAVPTLELHYIPEFDADETIHAAVGVVRDTTEDRRRQTRLFEEATRDPLTGLLNRRGLEALVSSFDQGPRARSQLHSLCVLDLDGFKAVNDALGHAAGDGILCEIADALTTVARRADCIVRLGGDEFLVVLEGCAPQAARTKGEAMVRAIAGVGGSAGAATAGALSASVGIAPYRPTQSFSVAMEVADAACYAAKRAGGGRVVIAGSSSSGGARR